jgi:hypothetical protein
MEFDHLLMMAAALVCRSRSDGLAHQDVDLDQSAINVALHEERIVLH